MIDEYKEFMMTTRVIMGKGTIKSLNQELLKLGLKDILLVTDKGIASTDIIGMVTKCIDETKIKVNLFTDVEQNPSVETIMAAFDLYKKHGCDGLLAVGGGSPIDTAKAVGVLATNGGVISDYYGLDVYKEAPAPIIVVPTTVGTGSEVTRGSVITDHKIEKKRAVVGLSLYPKIAFLDPELLVSLPPSITAATGMDALTHAIEGYVSEGSNVISDSMHRHAIYLIGKNIREAVTTRGVSRLNSIYNMQLASTIAGIAFGNSLLGLVHGLSHPVSARYRVSHGEGNAILLPHVVRFNWMARIEKYADISKLLEENQITDQVELARKTADIITALSRDVGIPRGLAEVGVDRNGIEMLANDAIQEKYMVPNPRQATVQDIIEIYNNAM